jgi:hypothetical protein
VIDLHHPANAGVLSYLSDPGRLARSVSVARNRTECLPADVRDPYMTLGTHPDVVTRLWKDLGSSLPIDCRVVVYGMPALVRPDSGVIIGIAGGTQMYALRLDAAGAAEARAAGLDIEFRYPAIPTVRAGDIVVDAGRFGETWVFGRWHASEPRWLQAGFLVAQ